MNFEAFQHVYASRWRPLTRADGLPEWMRDIERDDIDEAIMRSALSDVQSHHDRLSDGGSKIIAAPRLGEVMAAYRRVGEVRAPAGRKRRHRPKCGACDDGVLWVLVSMGGGALDIEMADIRKPRRTYGRIKVLMSCCVCQDDVNGVPGELPPDGMPYFASKQNALDAVAKWEANNGMGGGTSAPCRVGQTQEGKEVQGE